MPDTTEGVAIKKPVLFIVNYCFVIATADAAAVQATLVGMFYGSTGAWLSRSLDIAGIAPLICCLNAGTLAVLAMNRAEHSAVLYGISQK